jgi:hypothetical protein
MKEKLQEYALLAEILSATAVVASLIFVGFQVQQQSEETALNTRAIETAAYQDLISQIGLINTLVIENGDFAEIRVKGFSGAGFDNQAERSRFSAYANLVVRHGDLAYRQFTQGLISKVDLESVLTPMRQMIPASEEFRNRWLGLKQGLNPEYVEYIEELIESDT